MAVLANAVSAARGARSLGRCATPRWVGDRRRRGLTRLVRVTLFLPRSVGRMSLADVAAAAFDPWRDCGALVRS
ncbi:MAG: hypothetical protein JOZ09_16680 [Pseudonocardiales bacterium]|nr:hypothetical protein [Pseudonocardiales bacterium]